MIVESVNALRNAEFRLAYVRGICSLASTPVLVALHLISAYAVAKSPVIAKWVEGDAVLLAKDGVIREAARLRCKISLADIEESLREQGPDGMVELSRTRKLVLEPSGKISVQPGMLRLRHVNI